MQDGINEIEHYNKVLTNYKNIANLLGTKISAENKKTAA
jgi:hypothetical protein